MDASWMNLAPRLRRPILLAGVLLHLGISMTLNIEDFTTSILMCYLAFVRLPEKGPSEG
jgi:hypothetical protein